MQFVIYNSESGRSEGKSFYDTERGAKIALSRMFNKLDRRYEVLPYDQYLTLKKLNTKKIKVRSLMSGKEVEIDEDTPLCCDPSSESYWCM